MQAPGLEPGNAAKEIREEGKKMIHDRKTAEREGKRIATENGAPVWIEYDFRFGAFLVHETPANIPNKTWIIEPGRAKR